MREHVLPYIGDLLIAEVRARHLVDMFHKLRTDPNLNLAPRSIYNIYSNGWLDKAVAYAAGKKFDEAQKFVHGRCDVISGP